MEVIIALYNASGARMLLKYLDVDRSSLITRGTVFTYDSFLKDVLSPPKFPKKLFSNHLVEPIRGCVTLKSERIRQVMFLGMAGKHDPRLI